MANTSAAQMTILEAGSTPAPGYVDGTVRCFSETITYASQADGDTINVGRLPKGAVFLYGILTVGVSTGSATLAIGITGSAAKYRAAAVYTSVDTPAFFGKSAGMTANTAEETVIATVGTAALPSSGTAKVTLFYSFN